MKRPGLALAVLAASVLAGCLGPGASGPGSPPWTVEVDTTYQVCWENHDGSRMRTSRGRGSCAAAMYWHNATDLPNGTPVKGPDLYLVLDGPEPGPGYDAYPATQWTPPTWNYTPSCPDWSPGYSVRARHNRCDNTTIRERVTVAPIPTPEEKQRALEPQSGSNDPYKPWLPVHPFTEEGTLTLEFHRPLNLSLEVWGEYPAAYKEAMRDPGWCNEQVPKEHRDKTAPGAGGKTWVWSMSGHVEYADDNVVHRERGRYQEISNEVVVTGDAEITLAWQGDCIGGQY